MSEIEIQNEKSWEKPWNSQEIINNSNNWSLAGDAGLLLYLKQFSENITIKAANIEKELQKLTFEEQQCHVKFENTITNFLQLENTQFIENRVYEQDVTVLGNGTQNEKSDKTKEEKEQELFEIITESIRTGMAIMDTYFDKIDGSKLDESEDEDDDQEKNEDLVIYETKDPYVLRSLPYLIGSDAYLENDHVGLKDLEDEIEDEEEDEEEEEIDETETESESEPESKKEQLNDSIVDSESDNGSEDEELFNSNTKKDNLFDEDSEDEKDNFFTAKKKTENLFDEESNTDSESESVQSPETKEPSDEQIGKPLDFASELSRKLAMKANTNKENDQPFDQKSFEKAKPVETKHEVLQNDRQDLFGNSDSESEDESLFSKPSKTTKTLFDDDANVENNVKVAEKSHPKDKSLIFEDDNDEEDELFSKPNQSENKKSDLVIEPNKLLPNVSDTKPKLNKPNQSLFDSGDDESDDDFFSDNKVQIKPIKAAVQADPQSLPESTKISTGNEKFENLQQNINKTSNSTALDKNAENTKSSPEINKKPNTNTSKINSLFDDDSEDDNLFSKSVTIKTSEKKNDIDNLAKLGNDKPKISKPTASLFDDEDEDEDEDLFSNATAKLPKDNIKAVISENEDKKKNDEKKAIKTPNSILFDEEDDDEDLFSKPETKPKLGIKVNPEINTNKESTLKNVVVNTSKTTENLFDDDDEDLFSDSKNKPKLDDNKPSNASEDSFSKSLPQKSQTNDENSEENDQKSLKSDSDLIKPKPLAKNVLFDPLALKSSGLFKRLALNKESDQDSEIDEKIKDNSQDLNEPKEPEQANFFADISVEKKPTLQQNQATAFDDIKISTTPIINTAQKDRIKAISSKKRPPTKQRKRTIESQEIFENSEKKEKSEDTKTKDDKNTEAIYNPPVQIESDIKANETVDIFETKQNLIKPTKIQSNLFDNLSEDDDDIFKVDVKTKSKPKIEPKQESKKKEPKIPPKSLFDDLDDDIFSSNPKKQLNESEKPVENKSDLTSTSKSTIKQEQKKNIFDDLDDYEDIFADVPKKKTEKKKPTIEDSIFD